MKFVGQGVVVRVTVLMVTYLKMWQGTPSQQYTISAFL